MSIEIAQATKRRANVLQCVTIPKISFVICSSIVPPQRIYNGQLVSLIGPTVACEDIGARNYAPEVCG